MRAMLVRGFAARAALGGRCLARWRSTTTVAATPSTVSCPAAVAARLSAGGSSSSSSGAVRATELEAATLRARLKPPPTNHSLSRSYTVTPCSAVSWSRTASAPLKSWSRRLGGPRRRNAISDSGQAPERIYIYMPPQPLSPLGPKGQPGASGWGGRLEPGGVTRILQHLLHFVHLEVEAAGTSNEMYFDERLAEKSSARKK